jgi:hypothetical protein
MSRVAGIKKGDNVMSPVQDLDIAMLSHIRVSSAEGFAASVRRTAAVTVSR